MDPALSGKGYVGGDAAQARSGPLAMGASGSGGSGPTFACRVDCRMAAGLMQQVLVGLTSALFFLCLCDSSVADNGGETPRLSVIGGVGAVVYEDPASNVEREGSGFGGLLQAEYSVPWKRWIRAKGYLGALVTRPENDCEAGASPCNVSVQVAQFGGKVRIAPPLLYIAPFFEPGLGFALGHFSTRIGASVDESRRGLALQIPLVLGLALGRDRNFELALHVSMHPQLLQSTVMPTLGYSFALPQASPTRRYSPGDSVPDGYEVTQGPNNRLILIGAAAFAVPYLLGVTSNNRALDIPLVGPWIAIKRWRPPLSDAALDLSRFAYGISGLSQAAGVTLMALGFLLPRQSLTPTAKLEPLSAQLVTAPGGLGVAGKF